MIMFTWLINLGFYLYHGNPNTTIVSQETDQGYNKFKHGNQQDLDDLNTDHLATGKNPSPPYIVGLVVCLSRIDCFVDVFSIAFKKENIQSVGRQWD